MKHLNDGDSAGFDAEVQLGHLSTYDSAQTDAAGHSSMEEPLGSMTPAPQAAAAAAAGPIPTVLPGQETTLFITGIPARYTSDHLRQRWHNESIDFLHLPWNQKQGRTVAYAFVNFTSAGAAIDFCRRWEGEVLPSNGRPRPLRIQNAVIQGLEANLRNLQLREGASNQWIVHNHAQDDTVPLAFATEPALASAVAAPLPFQAAVADSSHNGSRGSGKGRGSRHSSCHAGRSWS